MNSEVRIKNSLNKLIIASYISKNSLIDCSMGLVVVISPVLTLLWTYQSCCSVTVDTELKREREQSGTWSWLVSSFLWIKMIRTSNLQQLDCH